MNNAFRYIASIIRKGSATEDIFPNLGRWNVTVEHILDEKYPPNIESIASQIDRIPEEYKFEKMSVWALICEEALDTEFEPIWYKRYYDEVIRRGVDPSEYTRARKFMWLTVGWLNFEKCLWDWCSLDQEDVYRAIEWQRAEKLINRQMEIRMKEYVQYILEFDKNI